MTANKFSGIRAAVCWSEESARLSREHNHANILCLGARLISPDLAIKILDTFLSTPSSEEPRHVRRVRKINMIEACSMSVDEART
jgi:ribose 5-phosphate isomerase B